ncbi:hypothetical protein Pcinc_018302 [Petrolisthes cinctipes]|uniref:Cadherin domain-containing protein n=1 Tax=Petrolisthes cinctipes TaxID=88211 RepID=A0AAE1KJC1_PETCI|nr:hypothetical protein Pcinc_018302 [Petrolisthes cinctipes]
MVMKRTQLRKLVEVGENTAPGTTIFTLTASDQHLTFHSHQHREVQEEHIDYACVIIKVQDYNDHNPQFLANLYNGTVTETASIGTTVTEVFAVDRDKGANGHIMYSIISGSSKRCTCWRDSTPNPFVINPTSGIVSLNKPVHFEEVQAYNFTVLASSMVLPEGLKEVTFPLAITKQSRMVKVTIEAITRRHRH